MKPYKKKPLLFAITLSVLASGANAKKNEIKDPCIHQKPVNNAVPKIAAGSSVYVYNFLDIRWQEYTPKVLDAIESKLLDCMKNQNQKIFTIRSKQTPFSNQNLDWRANYSADQQTANIPVGSIVDSNFESEIQKGTTYRLIMFPSNFEIRGAWRFYNIKWVLFSSTTGEELWSYEYEGRHMALWSNSENSEARAKKIISAAVDEMQKSNVY